MTARNSRPSARSPEFAPYFVDVINRSRTVGEAVRRLGYANPSIVYHHLRRFGLESPLQWRLKPYVSVMRQKRVPEVIMHDEVDRAWSGGLVQGEGGILAHYSKRTDVTGLDVRVAMTDHDTVFRLCDLFGVRRPPRSLPKESNRRPRWECAVGGLRAYRILQEILPYLIGGKRREAERALQFFAPRGYRKGRFGGFDVWPRDRYPSRSKGMKASRMNPAKWHEG